MPLIDALGNLFEDNSKPKLTGYIRLDENGNPKPLVKKVPLNQISEIYEEIPSPASSRGSGRRLSALPLSASGGRALKQIKEEEIYAEIPSPNSSVLEEQIKTHATGTGEIEELRQHCLNSLVILALLKNLDRVGRNYIVDPLLIKPLALEERGRIEGECQGNRPMFHKKVKDLDKAIVDSANGMLDIASRSSLDIFHYFQDNNVKINLESAKHYKRRVEDNFSFITMVASGRIDINQVIEELQRQNEDYIKKMAEKGVVGR